MNSPNKYPSLAPPVFLRLAGHPLRWRLLGELGRSDRTVQELTNLVGEPQNLVSYHLGKLRDACLVFARRSSADGRDNYYGLDLARVGSLLSAAGETLHPGLQLTPRVREEVSSGHASILFLCTGNSARSPMAAALASALSNGAIEASSAGSDPKPIHRNAVRVMREEYGLDLTSHISRHLDDFANQHFDRVISLCDRVREVCPEYPGQPETIHWSIPNPTGDGPDKVTLPRFRRTAAELATRIEFLLAALSEAPLRAKENRL